MIGHSSQITDNTEQLLGEILTELAERLSQGQPIDLTSYEAEYPQHAEKIQELLPTVESIVQLGLSVDASTGLHTGRQGINGKTGDVNEPLGDFRLLGEIGRGGMGVVYEAEQISIGRSVALKVLPFAAVLDHKAITRFKNEARAAGSLTHPNIVPVYGVGNERGVYYYAMALVHGLTLAEVIQDLKTHVLSSKGHDTQRFSLVEIVEQHSSGGDGLSVNSSQFDPTIDTGEMQESAQVDEPTVKELQAAISTHRSKFGRDYQKQITRIGVQAADALHYAHENGIVHRDIKPGNLMVDTEGKLWITDFGLARIESDIGMTRSGDLLGTLRYMAPEQALGKRIIVDHRADIYSLGATLYEMLALRPVFDGTDRETLLKQLTFEEPKPLRQVCPTVSTDLETIVMKAIAKNPDERYASAGDMAEDLRALEENRPIKAKPATLWVRGKKWVGRNQGLVTATVVILALATIGLGISNWMITHQRDAAQQAKEEESEQRAEAERQRRIAQENFERARDAVDEYLTRVSEEKLLNSPGMQPLREDLLQLALKYYQQFATERADDAVLQADLAQAFQSIGSIRYELGNASDAYEAHKIALEIREQLVVAHPEDTQHRASMAKSLHALGHALHESGNLEEAQSAYQRAIKTRRRLVAERPDVLEFRDELAWSLNNSANLLDLSGRRDKALSSHQEVAKIRQELVDEDPEVLEYQSGLSASLQNLARLLSVFGKHIEANDSYQKAIEYQQALADENPEVLEYQSGLAICLNNFAEFHNLTGKPEKSIALLEDSTEFVRNLVEENPEVPKYRVVLSQNLTILAKSFSKTGKRGEAIDLIKEAIKVQRKVNSDVPGVIRYRFGLANKLNHLAPMLFETGKQNEAMVIFRDSIRILRGLVDENPEVSKFQILLAMTLENLAFCYSVLGQDQKELIAYQESIPIYRKLTDENPEIPIYWRSLVQGLVKLGKTLALANETDASEEAFDDAMEILARVPEAERAAQDWRNLGLVYSAKNRWKDGRDAFDVCVKLREETLPTLVAGPRWLQLSIALAHLGEKEKAREYYLVLIRQFDDEAPAFNRYEDDLEELASLLGIEPESDQEAEKDEAGNDATDGTPDADKNDPEVK